MHMRSLATAFCLAVTSIAIQAQEEPAPPPADPVLTEFNALSKQVVALRDQGKLAETVSIIQRMIEIARGAWGADCFEVADWSGLLGDTHFALDEFDEARNARDEKRRVFAILFGDNNHQTLDARLAVEDVDIFARLEPDQRKRLAQAELDTTQALGHWQNGRHGEALPLAERAVAVRRDILFEHRASASALNVLALIQQDLGDYVNAKSSFEEALRLQKAHVAAEHPMTASIVGNLAGLHAALADYEKALPLYEESVRIRKLCNGPEHPNTSIGLNNLGYAHQVLGNFTKAVEIYDEALAIRKKASGDEHADTALILSNLGVVWAQIGDYSRSRRYHEDALRVRRKLFGDEHYQTASSMSNLGTLLSDLGDYDEAQRLLEEAVRVYRATIGPEHENTANAINNLAGIYEHKKDLPRAARMYEEAYRIWTKRFGPNHVETTYALTQLAGVHYAQGEYEKAREGYQRVLDIRTAAWGRQHPDTTTSITNLGLALAALNDHAGAEKLYEEALAIQTKVLGLDHPSTTKTRHNLARLADAKGEIARARSIEESIVDLSLARLELMALSQSEREQITYAASIRHQFDFYCKLVARSQTDVGAAYPRVLAWKGATTLRQRQLRMLAGDPALEATLTELRSVSAELGKLSLAVPADEEKAEWEDRLASLSRKKNELERTLSSESEKFRRTRERPTLEQFQASLPTGGALIDFVECDGNLLVFVVPKKGQVSLIDLGAVGTLNESIEQWRKAYSRPISQVAREEFAAGQEAAKQLRTSLWLPIEKWLGSATSVLVSPDGLLGTLPLGALPGAKDGTYLVEERAFAVVPIPYVLAELDSSPAASRPDGNVLLVGGVDYDAGPAAVVAEAAPRKFGRSAAGRYSWTRLDGTLGEVATIEKLYERQFGNKGIASLTDSAATEAAFRDQAPKHLYLHIATHGFFAPESVASALSPSGDEAASVPQSSGVEPGLLSGIVLAGANQEPTDDGDDGILTADEVSSLNLSGCELCVLSACETGLGKVAGGEGLLGLQRAFQVAGAKSVVATLWKVPDQETRMLVERFYANLWEDRFGKPITKLEALREAQLWMLKEHSQRGLDIPTDAPTDSARPASPFSWAAFVLSGDWR